MAWRSRMLVGIVLFMCAEVGAQEVTLSARIKVVDTEYKASSSHAQNVVVWLTPIGARAPAMSFSKQPLRLTQHNKSFEPHVLVVPVGSVVQFPNRDPFFHNVFSLFEGKRFDLGLYEAGSTRNVSFDRPGISYIFCNIHAEMSAVVIALDTCYSSRSPRALHDENLVRNRANGIARCHDPRNQRHRKQLYSRSSGSTRKHASKRAQKQIWNGLRTSRSEHPRLRTAVKLASNRMHGRSSRDFRNLEKA